MKAISRLTLLLIAFALLTLPGNVGEVLVCVGDAGHMVVVSAGDQGCHVDGAETVTDGHADCIDVTVIIGDGMYRTAQADRPALMTPPATLALTGWTHRVTRDLIARYRSPDWVATSPLVHRRTIVLLT